MSKVKYYYDPKTATYRKVESANLGLYLLGFFLLILGSTIGIVIYLQVSGIIQSPQELQLVRENEHLKFQLTEFNRKFDKAIEVLESLEKRDNLIYRLYFEATPISEDIRKAGYGGINRYEDLDKGFSSSNLIMETAKKIDVFSKELAIHSNSLDQVVEMARNKEAMLASIPAISPISDKESRLASGFGYRLHPILKIKRKHTGIDLAARRGTPIYATGDGTIEKAKRSGSYGKFVVINHGYGYKSIYAHMSKFLVSYGQRVKRGEIIGLVGNTGLSAAPHLHYEILKNEVKINPIAFIYKGISPEKYKKLIEVSEHPTQSLD